MAYRIFFTRRALRDLEAVPDRDRERIARRIDGLATEPRPSGARKLAGPDNLYRLRVSDYRVLYTVIDRVIAVTLVRIAHRRDIYR